MQHPEIQLTEEGNFPAKDQRELEAARKIWGQTSFDSGHFGGQASFDSSHFAGNAVTLKQKEPAMIPMPPGLGQSMPEDSWWSSQCPWPDPQVYDIVRPGCTVCFHGLRKAKELNGVHGVVEAWDQEIERWVVRLYNGEERYAKSDNLHILTSYPPPYFDCSMQYANAGYWQGSWAYQNTTGRSRKGTGSFTSDSTAATGWGSFSSDFSEAPTESKNSEACPSQDTDSESRTTVLMRNLPSEYTREMVVEMLNDNGFQGCYDLLYLPLDFKTEAALGYALINLVSPEDAERFKDFFKGFTKWSTTSEKICEVSWSDVQGVHKHVERHWKSSAMQGTVRDKFKPLFFENGKLISGPPAKKEGTSSLPLNKDKGELQVARTRTATS